MAGGLRIADAPAISQLEGTDKLPVSVGDNEAHSVEADKIKGFVNGSELDGSTVLGRIKNLETNLANEIQTRTEADTSLGDHKADKSYVDAELLAEANERERQYVALRHEIEDEATERGNADATLQQNIDNEALARQNADGSLQQAINDERDARILAVGDEATARGNADNTLQGNIDAEATTRGNADLNLQHNIDAEATIRHDADVTLQGNIDAEQQARILADNAEQLARQNADDALNTAKANKDEMAVVNGTGANADKVTIQLKSGMSATVLKTHQEISGKADKDTDAVQGNVAVFDANGNPVDSGSAIEETPTENSVNLSKSGGIWSWVTGLINTVKEWASNTFARIDGYYKTLVSGFSEQLLSPDGTIDETPYLFRTTAGSANVSTGAAELNEVKGNSIVFNQWFYNDSSYFAQTNMTNVSYDTNTHTLSFTTNSTTQWIVASGRKSHSSIVGHRYYICMDVFSNNRIYYHNDGAYTNFFITVGNQYGTTSISDKEIPQNTWTKVNCFNNNTTGLGYGFEFKLDTISDVQVKNFQVYDLTQMFGDTIANSMTVSQFESLFPLDYYTYNAGQIINFNGDILKTTGFNQYDKSVGVDNAYLDSNGDTQSNTVMEITDYIKVFPSTNYYFKDIVSSSAVAPSLCWYDVNKTFISSVSGAANINSQLIQSPSNAQYIRLSVYKSTKEIACMNLSWSGYRNGETEPYEEHTLPLYIKDIKDANNNYLFENGFSSALNAHDVVKTDKAVKNILTLNMGNLNWIKTDYYGGGFYISDSRIKRSITCQVICEKYKTLPTINESDNKFICANYSYWGGENGHIFVKDTTYTTVSDFKTAVNGVFVNVEMQTPIEVDFETVPQVFGTKLNLTYSENDFGTEEIVIDNPVGEVPTAPFSHTTFYMDNLRDKLRNIDGNTDDGALMNNSVDELLLTLGTATDGTFSKSWDATNKKWTFTFTPNQQGE